MPSEARDTPLGQAARRLDAIRDSAEKHDTERLDQEIQALANHLLTWVRNLVASVFTVLSSAKPHAVAPTNSPRIPRVWDDAEIDVLQLPLVDSTASPKQISADYYYRIPVRTIYKNYPVYAPGKEPAGYVEWLKQQDPQSAFDAGALKTEADWIRAGELVFDSPISYNDIAQISDVVKMPASGNGH